MSISDFADKTPGESGSPFETGGGSSKEQAGATAEPTGGGASPSPSTTTAPVANPTPPAPSVAQQANDILANVLNDIGDIGTNNNLKLMVIGPPGQGKSSLLASADNLLAFDFEDGLVSAKAAPHGVGQGTQSIPYKNMDQFRALVHGLATRDERLAQFKVFGIDTLSDLHKRDLAEITERDWKRQPSRNRYVPETEQYTEVNERIVRVVRALRDLPMDIIITSHSKTVEPKNGPSKTYADFSESLSNKVMAMMDIVGYLQFKKVDDKMQPVLRVVTDGTIYCKTRVPMPTEIINPSYQKIKELWLEGIKSA